MSDYAHRAVAVVGVGGILPDAPDAPTFWQNIREKRYSITQVPRERWDPADYYDPDPRVPDKTYSKIGGWVREFTFEPFKWRMPIPPKVLEVMDDAQKWAIAVCRAALLDYGYPDRPLDTARTAVILGNAMAGENHYLTALRIYLPEYLHALEAVPAFQNLPPNVRDALLDGMRDEIRRRIADITEDTMPGELANIIAGRVANALNLGGPNFITDAACASSFAALHAAIEGLIAGHFDAVLTGGVDRNMGAPSFVKFCKIGALSPDGSRPYAEGANGFVMGEGAVALLLKRLADAERDGDRVYAVIRGVGGASDGRGKGITAPNPIGQQRAIERAWKNAGLSPATATYIEGHGTSTRVGDVVEVESMTRVFGPLGLPRNSIALGSVKSNIGHLKGAAGAAGLLKTVYALRDKVLPPNVNFERPNPNIDFASTPFFVNTELRPWPTPPHGVRRAGVSSFGFGGTNFHIVLEEHIPGRLTSNRRQFPGVQVKHGDGDEGEPKAQDKQSESIPPKAPYRGLLLIGAPNVSDLRARLKATLADACAGRVPTPQPPNRADIAAPERLAIDFNNPDELVKRGTKAERALETDTTQVWNPLTSQGVFRGRGRPGKVAFLFPGQGSQYVNMLRELRDLDPVVADTFREADEVMTPLLGRPLSEYIFVEATDRKALKAAEARLRDTTITQPAVLTVDVALTRLLISYGIYPDLLIGHSLGEYAALVAAGVLSFSDALQVVSARGREMTRVSMEDNGCMAAIFAPLPEVERILADIEGYVVLANINSRHQVVIGGATAAVEKAIKVFQQADYRAVKIPVSHAFHTRIVAPAGEPLKQVIARMDMRPPCIPIVANVTGDLYPDDKDEIIDLLGRQIASPVQFVKGVETLYREGARVFVEVGPKRVLKALAEDILHDHENVTILFTNHPRKGDLPSFNQALCGIYAAGVIPGHKDAGNPAPPSPPAAGPPTPVESDRASSAGGKNPSPATGDRHSRPMSNEVKGMSDTHLSSTQPVTTAPTRSSFHNERPTAYLSGDDERYLALGRLFAGFLQEGMRIYRGETPPATPRSASSPTADGHLPITGSVVISGAGLGLPGRSNRVFDDHNIDRLLRGEQFIEPLPDSVRLRIAEKRINRLVKSEAGATFEIITDPERTIKLAGQRGRFDPVTDFGLPALRVDALDISTQLAICAGIEALRDAGIPLVMHYRRTSKGTYLPDRWMLPPALADETGVIFASAFPGLDRMAEEMSRFHEYKALRDRLHLLRQLHALVCPAHNGLGAEIERRIAETQEKLDRLDYHFDRKFIFRVLAMGHSQFAEYIGARGPNTHVNAACASTTHAIAIAEDWIRSGRCRRVIVVAGDDAASDNLIEWIGSGLLATGAATTESRLDRAALPFDRRRNGMIVGMGAAAVVLEAEDALRERGMRGICEVLATQIANSAFHGTRLDVQHIAEVMERLLDQAEKRFGINRHQIAPHTVFVSHETYTPARGGSAAAEIYALRHVFGEYANRVVIANTKGYTGHAMGVGIEDVLAVKALEKGIVPPIANILDEFQPDPELGDLNLSRGGRYPVQYALRLGAGFGSQIAMSLLRRIPGQGERVERQVYGRWLAAIAGYERADLEVVQRTLRIRDAGPPIHQPARSTWQYGQGPTMWAPVPQEGAVEREATLPSPSPAVATEPQAPETAQEAAAPDGEDEVAARVLALVAAKTGYPPDMLDPELDLEADLGIDTVKQAEILAAIRQEYAIPRRDDLRLRDYNTLGKVIAFVRENLPTSAKQVARQPEATAQEAAAPDGEDEVAAQVLALVAAKTGYPPDMLDPELDLEADLGIDTVKQAEILAAIRQEYAIPRRDDLRLRDYNTLGKVIAFVRENLRSGTHSITADLAKTTTIPRRVPVPMLRPDLELCKPTGVEFAPGSRVVIVADAGKAARYLGYRLRARKVKALNIKDLSPEQAAVQVSKWLKEGPIDGVYFLPALDVEPSLDEMDLERWQSENKRRVKVLYALMRSLVQAGNEPFLICGTRMGGLHGYNCRVPAPLGGAVSGFAKAYAREHPNTPVKVVDFGAADDRQIAACLLNETLHDPGAVEVGYCDGQRFGVGLVELEADLRTPTWAPSRDTVFLVTGGAGDITAAVVADLARASGAKFYLTGRTPMPDPNDPDLARLQTDRQRLKRDIAKRIKDSGVRPTPVMVERELAKLERAASILKVLSAVERAGGVAHYRVCDVTDPDSVTALVREIVREHGHLDVVIHAAGVERSHLLPDKPPEEFDMVFGVKADGLFNLLKAIREIKEPPKAIVAFSSIAGRFGNAGQTDYSAANDLMAKLLANLDLDGSKGIAIDWSAWEGIGMAGRGSIPEVMRRAGIEMLPPADAAPIVRRELLAANGGPEVVIARSLGVLLAPRDPTGGLDLEAANARLRPDIPLIGRIVGLDTVHGLTVEAHLDPRSEPFLRDHELEDTPLLPGVMGIEGFVEVATFIVSHLSNGDTHYRVTAVEDVRFIKPLKFYRHEPRAITWRAVVTPDGKRKVAYVTLGSTRIIKGREGTSHDRHFAGRVILEPVAKEENVPAPTVEAPQWDGAETVAAQDIYRIYFHGPSFQVLDGAQVIDGRLVGRLRTDLPPITTPEKRTLLAPRLIELCLQTAGVWEIGQSGRLALPTGIERVVIHRPQKDDVPLYAEIAPRADDEELRFDARVMDAQGNVYLELYGYRTAPLPGVVTEEQLAPLRAVVRDGR